MDQDAKYFEPFMRVWDRSYNKVMSYIVVAYPNISDNDLKWVQEYRQENDPRYFSVIDPHFTLAFAINDVEKSKFLEEVNKQVVGVKPNHKFPSCN